MTISSEINPVNLRNDKDIPEDYHCICKFCKKYKGLLIKKDGTKYSKLKRRQYYSSIEKGMTGHLAKTPLHLARWAIQTYSEEKDWVLDPTIGAGTTAVEALRQNRNATGIEIEYFHILKANLEINNPFGLKPQMFEGDAIDILNRRKKSMNGKFQLVVNNPPYSGDQAQKVFAVTGAHTYQVKGNLGRMKESKEYWVLIDKIYKLCSLSTKKNGYFVLGVKDMIRNKAPFLLHKEYGEILKHYYKYIGMVLLPHWPPTMFMSTYNKRFPGVAVPRYQTILIFKK